MIQILTAPIDAVGLSVYIYVSCDDVNTAQ